LYDTELLDLPLTYPEELFQGQLTDPWGTGIRGLMRGMATLPNVTRSY